jgi:hypothetical protein
MIVGYSLIISIAYLAGHVYRAALTAR